MATQFSSDSLAMVVVNPIEEHISCKQESSSSENTNANISAEARAHGIQSSLDPKFPSFVKVMRPSHVAGCFCMPLPKPFCDLYLPSEDAKMTLLDEDGVESTVKYLPRKWGLSGGWRRFSLAHKLADSDALVFQLVNATKFKVYIVRSCNSSKVDGVLPKLDTSAKRKHLVEADIAGNTTTLEPAEKRQKFLPLVVLEGDDQNISPPLSEEAVDSEVLDGIRLSDSIVEFQDIKNVESFNLIANNLVIDSEISEYVRIKYYELCCSQNGFLHEQLLQGLNYKLVAGIVSETVNIADAIKASKPNPSRKNEFSIWKKSLLAFKELGMNVDFLISRLEPLLKSDETVDSKEKTEDTTGRTEPEKNSRKGTL